MSSARQTEVKAFWDARARDLGIDQERVTHPDRNQRLLEIEVLLQYLPRGQRVLDVGCGNGLSTASLSRHSAEVVGIDYSAAMVERARRELPHLENARFEVGDVLDLAFDAARFDVAVTQRCLINLTSWEDQQKALRNIARVLKPGGCFFMQEGTQQGRRQLNAVREELGLPPMPPVPFNLDFDETLLWPFLRSLFEIVEIRRFGLYDLVSRVVHPLLVSPEEPRYDARINEVARHLAAAQRGAEDLSREFSAFLRRRDPETATGGR